MGKILVIGVGSVLRGDDGVGVKAIEALEKEVLPDNVTVEAGDLSGLDLLKFFGDYPKVIVIDAATMGEKPGTIKVFTPSEIKPATFKDKSSTHGMGLIETLTLAKELELDNEIIIVGIEPVTTEYELELTETIKNKIPEIISTVKELIQ